MWARQVSRDVSRPVQLVPTRREKEDARGDGGVINGGTGS